MKLLFAVRNVAAHAQEMREAAPPEPVFFQKPTTCLQRGPELVLPTDLGRIEFEAELAVRLGGPLSRACPDQALAAVDALGVVLDLTARELQARRKEASLPWFEAKGFDGACLLGPLVEAPDPQDWGPLTVSLTVNGEPRQRFRVADYAVGPGPLLSRLSSSVRLDAGDVIGCGTGAGVGPLFEGDVLSAEVGGLEGSALEARVVEGPSRAG